MTHALAILIAAVGAVSMAIGTQLQSSGVARTDKTVSDSGGGGFSLAQLLGLLHSGQWIGGTLLLGLSVVLQVTALSLAPIMVVQPVGIIALIITTYLNARLTHMRVGQAVLTGVLMCMTGIGAFVLLAATVAEDHPVTDQRLEAVLALAGAVIVTCAALFAVFGRRMRAIAYIIGAGVLFAFVSTLAKVVIARLLQHEFGWLTLIGAAALLCAAGLGSWFVQNAHASGPPDLVMAGLTVIDPLVAVIVGMTVLEEATSAPLWMLAPFIVTGALGVAGVFVISRHHPQVVRVHRAAEHVPERDA